MRKLKPLKVETVHLRGRAGADSRSIDVFLDRNEKDFFARIGTAEVRAATAGECEAKARELLSTWRPEEWTAWIAVSSGFSGRTAGKARSTRNGVDEFGAETSFRYMRFERAKSFDGQDIWREHAEDFEVSMAETLDRETKWHNATHARAEVASRRERRARLEDIKGAYPPEKAVLLPYSDELWAALVELDRRFVLLGEELAKILGTPERLADLAKILAGSGPKALPTPAEPNNPDEREEKFIAARHRFGRRS